LNKVWDSGFGVQGLEFIILTFYDLAKAVGRYFFVNGFPSSKLWIIGHSY